MLKKIFLCVLIIYVTGALPAAAQDSVLVNYLVKNIAAQQTANDAFFIKNIFPSYINSRQHFSLRKKDNNIFFTALIDYTLCNNYAHLSLINQAKIDAIHTKTITTYSSFKNKFGRNTYNFWRTDSAYAFPYTNWIFRIKKNTSLPDDMDDTALSLLAQNADSTQAAAIHQLMQQYINNNDKRSKSIDKNYRNYKAYSVWFGKRFPVVFDVCVLSNVLTFVQQYHLQWTAADSASLHVIFNAINSNDIVTKPLYISPYYGNTSIILYHLARLMSIKEIPELEALKPQLIALALQQFLHTKNLLEKAILSTAIVKWKYAPPPFETPAIADVPQEIEQNNLPFFIGNIPSYFPQKSKQFFTQKKLGLFYHYCPAYNDALLLEYLVLKQADNF